MPKIFLDMDGVLTDFHRASLAAHDAIELYDQWPEGEYDIAKVLGVTEVDFWDRLNSLEFWVYMPKLPEADDLMSYCKTKGEVIVLTSAAQGYSASGKEIFLRNHYPGVPWVMTRHKHLLAKDQNTILIDDWFKNVKEFESAGGRAIHYPAKANGLKHIDGLSLVRATL